MLYGRGDHRQLQYSAPPLRPRSRVRRSTPLLRELMLHNTARQTSWTELYAIVIPYIIMAKITWYVTMLNWSEFTQILFIKADSRSSGCFQCAPAQFTPTDNGLGAIMHLVINFDIGFSSAPFSFYCHTSSVMHPTQCRSQAAVSLVLTTKFTGIHQQRNLQAFHQKVTVLTKKWRTWHIVINVFSPT